MQRVVDPVATALLGDFVRGAFRSQVGGEGFWVRDAGEVGAFEDVLVVGFGGEEEGRGFGTDGCYTKCRMLENLSGLIGLENGQRKGLDR